MQGARARTGWRAEVCATLELLEGEIEDLFVRGLSAANADDVRTLDHAARQLDGAGASFVAARIDDVIVLQKAGAKTAAKALLQLQTTLRVFERVLTLEAVEALLGVANDDDVDAHARTAVAPATTAGKPAAALLPSAEGKRLLPVLEDLARAVEDLVATGLVTASKATKEKLEASFKEASRLKLGRLAASLRYVMEELGRYLDGAPTFSAKRLALFLGRSWMLGRGLALAISEKNEAAQARLLWSFPAVAVDSVVFVALGVRKRLPQGTGIVAFDFHLRVVDYIALPGGITLARGAPLVWSHIVPRKDASIPAEALLHLEIKPAGGGIGWKPVSLTDPKVFAVDVASVVVDGRGGGRLLMGPQTRVRALERTVAPADLAGLAGFVPADIADRAAAWQTSPLDLEVEHAEEVLVQAVVGKVKKGEEGAPDVVVVSAAAVGGATFAFDVKLPRTEEWTALATALRALAKTKKTAPIFGVLHFDRCQLCFAPLSVVDDSGVRHLMISTDKVDLKTLTRSLF